MPRNWRDQLLKAHDARPDPDILATLGIESAEGRGPRPPNNTFFANIHLLREGKTQVIDSRPSDALALALRAGAPIYVEERVIEKSRNIDVGTKISDLEKEKEDKLKDFLENLDPTTSESTRCNVAGPGTPGKPVGIPAMDPSSHECRTPAGDRFSRGPVFLRGME